MLALRFRLPRLAFLSLCAASTFASGCALFGIDEPTALVNVYADHHPSPVDGMIPEMPPKPLVFETDEGWEIVLVESVVTTAGVALESCDGETFDAEMYFGPLPEDLTRELEQPQGVGAAEVPGGRYCRVVAEYGPYIPEGDEPFPNPVSAADGKTVYLRGSATKGEVRVEFEISEDFRVGAPVMLPSPLDVDSDASVVQSVLVTKTYDRFFEGIDFTQIDAVDWRAQLEQTLVAETRVTITQ